jgi:hypothetical protein
MNSDYYCFANFSMKVILIEFQIETKTFSKHFLIRKILNVDTKIL